MKIERDKIVTVAYTVKNKAGEVLNVANGEPLTYLHGYDQIITGLEQQLEGHSEGDQFVAEVSADLAFGERIEQLVQMVKAEKFQGVPDLKPGMHFQADTGNGIQSVVIVAVDGENVTIDANHPLAGMDLIFEINIISVRDADENELPG